MIIVPEQRVQSIEADLLKANSTAPRLGPLGAVMIRIFVGNLPYSASYNDLLDAFSAYGAVENLHIVTDRDTGRSKGFAFLEMPGPEGNAAIAALNGADYDGRNLEVAEAPLRRGHTRTSTYHRPSVGSDGKPGRQ
jgi:RNA recognition motif-containing protein